MGTFLASIEATVVGTAMPSIAEQLGGFHLYAWVFSAYLLAQTVSIPLYGRLADLWGRRATYVGGVSLFLVGSVACGLAPTMELLVAARALQGLGAGAVLPLTMTIFGDLYDVEARTKLQGLFSLVWGVSSVAGPLAGGAIVQHWTWPFVFWINLPFGLVSLALVGLLLREQGYAGGDRRIDWAGMALLSAATLLLLVALLPAEQRPGPLPGWAWLALAAAGAAAFLAVERGRPTALVPLDLFRDRVHVAANGAGVLLGVVLFGVVSYVPLYVQAVRGGTPVSAGAALIPLSLGWSTASVVAGRLVRRVGFQNLVRTGSAMIAAGAALALLGVWREWPAAVALAGLTSWGVGMGCCISSFTVSVQERVPPRRRGIATALTQFSRSIGGAVGVALLGALLLALVGLDPTAQGDLAALTDAQRAALARGLTAVFAAMCVASLGAAAVAIALFPRVVEGMAEPDRSP